ncbi:uncharacterized protein V1516DRAFT_670634 [Lipomyces oligophaga]|uniref:uncharacterized protein n=1 Tax=Lipomyces oligophaga TaxID=45792 RepID=UPI0034CF845A
MGISSDHHEQNGRPQVVYSSPSKSRAVETTSSSPIPRHRSFDRGSTPTSSSTASSISSLSTTSFPLRKSSISTNSSSKILRLRPLRPSPPTPHIQSNLPPIRSLSDSQSVENHSGNGIKKSSKYHQKFHWLGSDTVISSAPAAFTNLAMESETQPVGTPSTAPGTAVPGIPTTSNSNNNSNNNNHSSYNSAPSPPANAVLSQVWLVSVDASALAKDLVHDILLKGHYVALGCKHDAVPVMQELFAQEYGEDRVLVLELDPRNKPLCQSALAQIAQRWNRIDIVVCAPSKSIVGCIEEASEWHIREQYEESFYGPMNLITIVLPVLRRQRSGHIICITGVLGQMGSPSLGLVSSAAHALEGYIEALAFEIAPFNIKASLVEPALECAILSGSVQFTKPLDHYKNSVAHTIRTLLSCTDLSPELLVRDVVFAVVNIAGIDNPPSRIVAGVDAIEQAKDKLRTVSEEMEDMLEVSYAADKDPLTDAQRRELAGE